MTKFQRASARTLLLACVSAASLASTPTFAHTGDQEATETGEVLVTARRTAERILDVPLAVTALDAAALERQDVQTIADVRLFVPSLAITPSSQGPSQPGITLRGQRASRTFIGQDPAVAVYVNEAVQTRPAGLSGTMFDVESVQVINGPQGTLFGRNTTGGAILITPTKPSADLDGFVSATLGNLNRMQFTGATNIPVSDTLMLRVAGDVSKRDGYMLNMYDGTRSFDENSSAWRAQALWRPSDRFETLFMVDGYESDTNGFLGKLRSVRIGSLAGNYDGVLPSFDRITAADSIWKGEGNIKTSDRTKALGVSNITTYELTDALTVKNVASYREVMSNAVIDNDGSAGDGINSLPQSVSSWWSEELQLIGTGPVVDWITGLYYYSEQGRDYQFTRSFLPIGANSLAMNGGTGKNRSFSGFIHGTVKLDSVVPGLSVVGGIRYTDDYREITAQAHNVPDLATGVVVCNVRNALNERLPGTDCNRTVSKSFRQPTWNMGLNWKLDTDNLLYLAMRQGYRAGGFNVRAINPGDFTPFEPETVRDYEIGFKTAVRTGDLRANFSAAAYYQDYQDIQRNVTITVLVDGINLQSSTVFNAAAAKLKGFEMSADLRWRALGLSGNFSALDTSYDNYVNPATGADLSDNEFADAPKRQGSITLSYSPTLAGDIGKLDLSTTLYSQSAFQLVDINLNPYTRAEGYTLINAQASLKDIAGSGLALKLFVSNLTNAEYILSGTSAHSGAGYTVVFPGAPRTYGAEVSFRF